MPRMRGYEPWLYDDGNGDIVGHRDSDGSDFYFSRQGAYGSWVSLVTQSPGGSNTTTEVNFEVEVTANGISQNGPNRVIIGRTGIYEIRAMLMFRSAAVDDHTASVWLGRNSLNLANSRIDVTLPKEHANGRWFVPLQYSWTQQFTFGDDVRLLFSTPSGDVHILSAAPSVTTPAPARPAIPSASLTITQVGM